MAGQRALHGHHGHRHRTLLLGAGQKSRHPAERRPQAIHPGAIRGVANRSGQVVAVRDGPHAGGHGRRRTTTGTARRMGTRPRVVGAAMQVVFGEPPHRERRRVGAADDHRAGPAQVGHHRAVFRCDVVLERDHAVGGGAAAQVDVDLHRHRHAVQRAQCVAAPPRGIGGIGRRQGLVGQHIDDGVQCGVDRPHTVQGGHGRLPGRHRAGADGGSESIRRPAPQGFRHRGVSS